MPRLRLGDGGLQPGAEVSLLPEQVRIRRPRSERDLSADVAVVGLQPEGDGGDDEQKEK